MPFSKGFENYEPPPGMFQPTLSPARTLAANENPVGRGHKPTPALRQAVERAAGFGLYQHQIAHLLGIMPRTLKHHYADELARGPAVLQSDLVAKMVDIAMDDNHKGQLEAIKFLLGRRFGWTEKASIELTGRDGGAVQIETAPQTLDARRLSPEQRDNLRELLLIAAQPTEDAEYEEVSDE